MGMLSNGYTQVILFGLICLSGPGIFNGITGSGGAGSDDPEVASSANTLLYISFGTLGFFGGALFNILGAKLMFFVGGIGYAIYGLSQYLIIEHPSLKWFAISAGFLLGISASMLWTAQGACTLAYAPPGKEAKYISTFWLLFSCGGLVGGILMCGGNWFNEGAAAGRASPGSYYALLACMLIGPILSITLIVRPSEVIREDGECAVVSKCRPIGQELNSVFRGMADLNMHLMAPFFFLSLMWYAYIFNGINEVIFNIRSRGFNSSLFWLVQMFGSKLALWILDDPIKSRRELGVRFFWILVVFSNCTFIFASYVQYLIEFGWLSNTKSGHKVDFLDATRAFIPTLSLVMFSINDSLVQSYCMWMNCGLADGDPYKMAHYSGFFKSVQSIGAALSWAIDSNKFSYRFQLIMCWAVLLLSLPTTLIANNRLSKYTPELRSRAQSKPSEEELLV